MQDTIAYFAEFEKPKITYQRFQVSPGFALDTKGYYTNDAVWILSTSDLFLLGGLNFSMGWFEISRHCTKIQNGYQLIWDYFKNVRIPNPPPALRDRIAAVAQQCLDEAGSNTDKLSALEAKLNALVYEAYGLDAEDIAVIEGSVGARG